MYDDSPEYDEFDRLADEIESAENEGRCLFDEDDECQVHHSYRSGPDNKCLWSIQHISTNP